jgi:NADP-dependent 3-hydroxy acid dehydrogenase YdfG
MSNLKNKNIIVTGASGGIGNAINKKTRMKLAANHTSIRNESRKIRRT